MKSYRSPLLRVPFVRVDLGRRPDVLVHPEEILRTVFLLYPNQPVVVGAVGSSDAILFLLRYKIHVGSPRSRKATPLEKARAPRRCTWHPWPDLPTGNGR